MSSGCNSLYSTTYRVCIKKGFGSELEIERCKGIKRIEKEKNNKKNQNKIMLAKEKHTVECINICRIGSGRYIDANKYTNYLTLLIPIKVD